MATPKPKAKVKAEDCVKYNEGDAVVTLSRPAKVHGQLVETITMREPTVRDQKAAQRFDDAVDVEINAVANLCNMTPDDVEALPLRDFRRLQVAYMGFID